MKTKKILMKATALFIGMTLFTAPVTAVGAQVQPGQSGQSGQSGQPGKSWLDTDEKEVKAVSHEIKSIDSDDYKDLEFLKPILKDKTLVCLGESFHRVAQYSSMKTRLIKYLHENLGFDVIAFESDLGDCTATYEDTDKLTSKQIMEDSIFPVWHSKETLGLFDYIKEQKKTAKPLYLTGYDMQPTTLYSTMFMSKWMGNVDKEYAKEYAAMEIGYFRDCYSILNKYVDDSYKHAKELKQIENKYAPQYEKAVKFIEKNKKKLAAAYPDNPNIIAITEKVLSEKMKFVEMAMKDTVDSYEFRDRIMAQNVEWIMKTMYPGKKVILWAHNDHLAKNTSKILEKEDGKWINSFTSMGEILNKELKDKEYVLGFYANRGRACSIVTQKNFDINPMPKGSLENIMAKSGYKYSFVDLSGQKAENESNSWMFNPMFAGEDGMTGEVIVPMSSLLVPKDQYDGILLIDKVKEPTLDY